MTAKLTSLRGLELAMERLRLDTFMVKHVPTDEGEPWHVAFGQLADRTHGRLGSAATLEDAVSEALSVSERLDVGKEEEVAAMRQERRVRRIAIGDYVILGEGECVRATDRAVLIELDGDEHWFPLSVLRDAPYSGWSGEVVCKQWFAEKEGLI